MLSKLLDGTWCIPTLQILPSSCMHILEVWQVFRGISILLLELQLSTKIWMELFSLEPGTLKSKYWCGYLLVKISANLFNMKWTKDIEWNGDWVSRLLVLVLLLLAKYFYAFYKSCLETYRLIWVTIYLPFQLVKCFTTHLLI